MSTCCFSSHNLQRFCIVLIKAKTFYKRSFSPNMCVSGDSIITGSQERRYATDLKKINKASTEFGYSKQKR